MQHITYRACFSSSSNFSGKFENIASNFVFKIDFPLNNTDLISGSSTFSGFIECKRAISFAINLEKLRNDENESEAFQYGNLSDI